MAREAQYKMTDELVVVLLRVGTLLLLLVVLMPLLIGAVRVHCWFNREK